MSADKHRSLRIRAAYLRLAGADDPESGAGFAVNVKWARKLTPLLRRMAEEGEVVLRRMGRATRVLPTDAGRDRLRAIDARFGPSFGTGSDVDAIEPPRSTKAMRRRRAIDPWDLRQRRLRRDALLAARR